MSQENVELVREGFARWNEGDYDFFFSFAAPDIELLSRFGSLTGEPYRGHEGVREWLADIQQSFERFELWLDDVRDLGDEVLAIEGIHMRARGSGLDMKEPMGWVFEVRDGRVARMRFYAPPAEALEAVGLREQPMSQENVAIVRRIYASWAPGSSPAESNLLHPDIEWVNPSYALEPGTRTGIEAFTAITGELNETVSDFRMDVERFVDAGDRVAVIATMRGRGSGSGVEVENRHGSVWTIRDGKAVRFEWFSEPDEALEAVGLRE